MTESILKTSIPKGQTMSNAIDLRAGQLVRVGMPDDWTSAPLTFVISADNNIWRSVVDRDGRDYIFAVTPKAVVVTNQQFMRSLGWLRLRSGIREKQTPQAADREFELILYVP
jgi:hypothetical protein